MQPTAYSLNVPGFLDIKYDGQMIYRHNFTPNVQRQHAHRLTDSFNPNSAWNSYTEAKKLWPQLLSLPSQHGAVSNTALLNNTRQAVTTQLQQTQRTFYADVVTKLATSGHAIQVAGQHLTGAKRLWEAYIVMGLPLSVEQNDILRSLLYGSEAILSADDSDGNDDLLNDIADMYRYFSVRADTPPAQNIMVAAHDLVQKRVTLLTSMLHGIISRLANSDVSEAQEALAPTLTRLRLLTAP